MPDHSEDITLLAIRTARQVRESFDGIDGLADTLSEVGQLHPIRVRKEGDYYLIVDGERRYRAAKQLGWKTISCIVEQKDLSAGEVTQRQLIANCQREDLKPLEK